MYLILLITFIILIVAWLPFCNITRIWISRPITAAESILAGITSWIFLFTLPLRPTGIVLTIDDLFSTYKTEDLFALIFAVLITGYAVDFIVQSQSEIGFNETLDFITRRKDAENKQNITFKQKNVFLFSIHL